MKPIRKRISQCLNCQTMLSAKHCFCPTCGQENHHSDFSLKELLNDFFSSLINFDNKIWNTFKTIFRPGQITQQYIKGKRIRFVPPFKFFLFISFIFFLLLNFSLQKASHSEFTQKILKSIHQLAGVDMVSISEKDYVNLKNANSQQIQHFIDSVFQNKSQWNSLKKETFYHRKNQNMYLGFRLGIYNTQYIVAVTDLEAIKDYRILMDIDPKFDTISIEQIQITQQELQMVYGNTHLTDSLITAKNQQLGHFDRLNLRGLIQKKGIFIFGTPNQITEFMDNQIGKYLSITSYTMLLMLPLVSVLLLLFFRKKYQKIYIHLIHSLHLHSAIMLFISILLGLSLWLGMGIGFWISAFITLIGSIFYFTISNKVLYQEKVLPTFLKSILLTFLYVGITLYIAFLIGMILMVYV